MLRDTNTHTEKTSVAQWFHFMRQSQSAEREDIQGSKKGRIVRREPEADVVRKKEKAKEVP